MPFRLTRNWSTDSDLGTETKHKLELRNWALRNHEGLRGSEQNKKIEPLNKKWDFLSLSGGVGPGPNWPGFKIGPGPNIISHFKFDVHF